VIRESSKSESKTVAKDAERARRREMELAFIASQNDRKRLFFASAAELSSGVRLKPAIYKAGLAAIRDGTRRDDVIQTHGTGLGSKDSRPLAN